jgi:type IV secretory pathway VirB10-like protein
MCATATTGPPRSLRRRSHSARVQGIAYRDLLEGTYYAAASLFTKPLRAGERPAAVTFNLAPPFQFPPPVPNGFPTAQPFSDVPLPPLADNPIPTSAPVFFGPRLPKKWEIPRAAPARTLRGNRPDALAAKAAADAAHTVAKAEKAAAAKARREARAAVAAASEAAGEAVASAPAKERRAVKPGGKMDRMIAADQRRIMRVQARHYAAFRARNPLDGPEPFQHLLDFDAVIRAQAAARKAERQVEKQAGRSCAALERAC